MKQVLFFLLCNIFLNATPTLKPVDIIEINGTVKDMVLRDNLLIVATDMGHIEVKDITTKKNVKTIAIPNVKDFMGDEIPARVMSTDKIDNQYLILSDSGKGGYSNLYIYDTNLTQILSAKDKKAIIKARFIDKNHILLGYLSNEISLFNIKTKTELYKKQLSESKFSDFTLNLDKGQAVVACESGILSIVDTHKGTVLQELKGVNKDNVYKVAFRKGIITAAGQDRKAVIYNLNKGSNQFIQGSFLIYATGISPSSQKVAFALDEENNISIFNSRTKEKLFILKGQESTLNNILFKDEKTLFSSSSDSHILIWNLINP